MPRLSDFLKAYDPSEQATLIKNNHLQWIVAGNRERTQSASISIESYERRLNEILENPKEENQDIFDKIENEFGQIDCESKHFIRALVISVCTSCQTDNKIDPELFQIRGKF